MKTLVTLTLLLAAVAAPIRAQNPPPAPPASEDPGDAPWKKHGKKKDKGPGADLTAEEKQRLAAAREKADQDPTVRSLREAREKLGEQLDNATRAAMLAADPTLGPTLDKIKAARDRAREMRDKFESLTPEDKQRLRAARKAAKDDPAVVQAREKMRAAEGPEAKRETGRAVHEAMRAAMLKTDPGLAPLLDKLGPKGFGRPGGLPPDFDGPMGGPGME